MAYVLVVHRKAEKAIDLLPEQDRGRILKALGVLMVDPFIGKKLSGKYEGRRSYRIGSYRIIYAADQRRLVVFVVDVGQRGGVY